MSEDISAQLDQAHAPMDTDMDFVSTNSPNLEAFCHLALTWRLNQAVGLKMSIFSRYGLCLTFGGVVIEFEEFFNLIDVRLPDSIKLPFTKAALTTCRNFFFNRNLQILEMELLYTWRDPDAPRPRKYDLGRCKIG